MTPHRTTCPVGDAGTLLGEREVAFLKEALDGVAAVALAINADCEIVSARGRLIPAAGGASAWVGRPFSDTLLGRCIPTISAHHFEENPSPRRYHVDLEVAGTIANLGVVVASAPLQDGTPHYLVTAVDVDVAQNSPRPDGARTDFTAHRAEQMRLALDGAKIGLWDYDLIGGTIQWDAQAREIFGRPDEEVIDFDTAVALAHPEERELVLESVNRAMAGENDGLHSVRQRILRPDGEVRHIETRGRVLFEGVGDARRPIRFVGIFIDMTDRLASESALNRSQERVRLAARAGGVGFWETDVATGAIRWDEKVSEIFGVESAPDGRAGLESIVHPDDVARLEAAIGEALKEGEGGSYLLTHGIVRPDGEERTVQTGGQVVRGDGSGPTLVGTAVDLTERLRTEMALRETDERLRLALRSAGMGTWEWDLRTDRTTFSAEGYRVWGIAPERGALNLQQVLERVREDHRENVNASLEAAVAGDGRFEHEFPLIMPRGDLRWLRGVGKVEIGKDGVPVRVIGVNYDVTRQHQETQARELLIRELNHRVKNMLALVRSIARLSGRRARTLDGFLKGFEGRLRAIAGAQDVLVEGDFHGASVGEVATRALAALGKTDTRRVSIEAETLWIDPQTAQTLAILLHELAENALQHGALSGNGRVALSIARRGEAELRVEWREQAPDIEVVEPDEPGFGLTLIERASGLQNGSARFDWNRDGLTCEVALRAAAVHAPESA